MTIPEASSLGHCVDEQLVGLHMTCAEPRRTPSRDSNRRFNRFSALSEPASEGSPLTHDNDKSRSLAFRQSKISGLYPPLTPVRTPHSTEPLAAFSDPPVKRAAGRPRCQLDLDRRIDLSAIGFAVLTRIEIPHGLIWNVRSIVEGSGRTWHIEQQIMKPFRG